LNALRDIDSIREVIVGQGLVALTDVPAIPIFVAVCFMLHPWFGVLAVIAAATLLMLTVLNEGLTKPDVKAAHAAAAHAGAHAEAALRNVEVLQAMGMRAPMRATWLKLHAEALDRSDAAGRKGGRIGAATKFARLAIQTAVLGIGAHLAIQREISPGAIIAASIIVGRVIAPVEQLIANWKAFIHARGARARLDALLSNHGAGPKPVALPRPVGRLTIDQMSAAPPGGRHLVLQRVSLALEAGETLAVVGPSASGKSSLARVICGVWRPMAGTVRLDGAELHHWDPEKLGDHIGYLPQDVELFAGTVAQNIARFREAAPAEVIETAKLAGCHDMIQSLPDGYNTQIGERGVALSGGQRQRIGLARAFFGMPPLVVLDEPNANLDAEGEAALVQAIRRYRGAGRTIVLITHRPSVVSDVDKVLLIVEGQPRLFGPRDEVLAQLTPAAAA
jgi:ATP-binding cassette subfamily C protein